MLDSESEKRIARANKIMGLTTISSVLCFLLPDVVASIDTSKSYVMILYSLQLDKAICNFALYMIYHTEIRSIYLSFVCGMKGEQKGKEREKEKEQKMKMKRFIDSYGVSGSAMTNRNVTTF